jgi:plastocyanin
MGRHQSTRHVIRFALALVMSAGTTTSRAAVLRGELHIPSSAQRIETVSSPYTGQAGSLPHVPPIVHGAPVDAVIYLDRIPAAAESVLARAAGTPRLVQRDQSFDPRVLAVAVGTTVEFPNADPIFHNVFSVSPVKRFDLGRYPKGHSKRVTFDRPGLVNVYCEIHTNMAAYVLVLPHHAFAQPAADGAFALPDVPPGHYQLHVWHPDLPEMVRDLDLPADGTTLDLRY